MTHSPTFTAVEPHPLIEQAHGNEIGRQLLELSRMIAIPVVTAYDILALIALRAAQDRRESGEAEPSLKRRAQRRGGFVQVCSGSSAECFISTCEFFKVVAKDVDPFNLKVLLTSSSHPECKWWRYLSIVGGRAVECERQPHIWG